MNLSTKASLVSMATLAVLASGFAVYYLNTSGEVANWATSNSSLQSQVSSLRDIPPVTKTETSVVTITSVVTTTYYSTISLSTTVTTIPAIPWNNSIYLSINTACTNEEKAECWSSNYSLAIVFSCAAAAAAPQGCTATLNGSGSAYPRYSITIWFPYVQQSQPPNPFNCEYSVPVDGISQNLAYCISLNSMSFILSLPQPITPPPP
jgi:hypothetical protein